jgi:MFS family permease
MALHQGVRLSDTPKPRPAQIGALWVGIQAVWSALLGVFLQARVTELAPRDDVRTYAWLAAAAALIGAFVQVVAGIASDRRLVAVGHRREWYVAGIALTLPSLLGFFAAPTIAALAAALVALEIGMNLVSGPYQAAIPDAIPSEATGRASAWMSAYQFCGSVAGFVVAATLRGLAPVAALSLVLLGSLTVTLAHLRRLAPFRPHARRLHIDRDAATVLISRGAINVGFYTLFGFMFFFVRESLRVTDARATTGLLFLVFTLAGIVGAPLGGRLADRWDKRVIVSGAGVAFGLAVGTLAVAFRLPVAFAAAVVGGIAWGAFLTVDWAIAYTVLPREAMASAMGVWNLATALPQVVAPALTAPLVAALDERRIGLGPRVALILVIVEFAFGTAWLWRLGPLFPLAAGESPRSEIQPPA